MIAVRFEDRDLEELLLTGKNKKYKLYARDKNFMQRLRNVYNTISSVNNTSELSYFSFLHYEKLKYCNLSSVRIIQSRVERLLFSESDEGVVITLLEINKSHYGNKK
jgi:plasmid maintenance system killer protein